MREVSTLAEAGRCLLVGVSASPKRWPWCRSALGRRILRRDPSYEILASRCDTDTLRRLALGRYVFTHFPRHRATDSCGLAALRRSSISRQWSVQSED